MKDNECETPLWSSGQSSWLEIRRPGVDSRHYQKKNVVGLERGPLSLVVTTEELLDRKLAASVYKIENTVVGIRHDDHVAPSIDKKLAITSPTSGGRSVGIVHSRTQTMEFSFSLDECGTVGRMIGRGNRNTRRKHARVPLCPPQIPHDLN
jgi:hypothetical protein